ncbi:MAG: hypothetical protein ABSE62_00190 [Chthoniobacteraceae bacterium]
MPVLICSRKFPFRIAGCAAAALVISACANAPRYKPSSGHWDEWQTYETKHFSPSDGVVTAIDVAANTVTIRRGKDTKVYPVTADVRIIHEGTDVPLAQIPIHQQVKFALSQDGQRLLSIWFGTQTFQYRQGSSRQQRALTL